MKKLWNKILDLFHIEHHEVGTLRIVQMADGKYRVQQWSYGDHYSEGLGWRYVKRGLNQITFDTYEEARNLYTKTLEERQQADVSSTIRYVILQQEE